MDCQDHRLDMKHMHCSADSKLEYIIIFSRRRRLRIIFGGPAVRSPRLYSGKTGKTSRCYLDT